MYPEYQYGSNDENNYEEYYPPNKRSQGMDYIKDEEMSKKYLEQLKRGDINIPMENENIREIDNREKKKSEKKYSCK